MQILVVILVGGFAVVDAMSIGLGDVERYSYAAISGVLIASLFIGRRYNRSTRSIRRILQVYMGIVGIGLVMVLLQPTIRWMYVVGDLVSVAMPLIILVLGMRSRDTFFDTRMLRLLTVVLLIASIIPICMPDSWGHRSGRFEQPPLLLAVLTCVGLLRPPSMRQFLTNMAAFIAVLALTLLSGARSALLLYLATGVVLYTLRQVPRQVALLGFISFGTLLLVLESGILASLIPMEWRELRFSRFVDQYCQAGLLEGILKDQSMNNRILESEDALYERRYHHGWWQMIFGSGHGATFEGVTAFYGDRAQADGQVHHIHFGLVLLYYRYGIPGLLAYCWLAMAALRQLVSLRHSKLSLDICYPSLIFSLGTLGYLAELLLFNQLVDPVLSLTIAGFLATRDIALTTKGQPISLASGNQGRVRTAGMPRYVSSRNQGHINSRQRYI